MYRVVEVGDRKGNQFTKGLAAKRRAHVRVLTLPPRTPELMPLDARLRKIIEDRMDATAPSGTEAKAAFLQRLRRTAKSLPKTVVRRAIENTPTVLSGIIEAKGYHPKCDRAPCARGGGLVCFWAARRHGAASHQEKW